MAARYDEDGNKKRYFHNKNGYLTIEEILTMMLKDEWDNYLSNHTLSKSKCNIEGMKPDGIHCFYCMDCFANTTEKIKEFKDHFKFKGKKYLKSELLNEAMPGLEELKVENSN